MQILLVAVITTAFVLGTDAIGFRHPVNFLWMFALPAALGLVLNKGDARLAMPVLLLIVATIVGIVVGVNFTSYI